MHSHSITYSESFPLGLLGSNLKSSLRDRAADYF